MVHPVCAVLATGAAGLVSTPHCLAHLSTIPLGWDRFWSGVCSDEGCPVFASALVGLAKGWISHPQGGQLVQPVGLGPEYGAIWLFWTTLEIEVAKF